MTPKIYADYAASTPIDPKVTDRVRAISDALIGNPSSAHGFGHAAWIELNAAREELAKFLNAKTDEIYFTSSGTESNNLAILGVAKANKSRGKHIVTTTIEHPSILNACRALEKDGWQISYVSPDKNGVVAATAIAEAVTKETILVTTHLANSEIGVVQNIADIAKAVKAKNANTLIHVDACQASSYIKLDIQELGADLLTINGTKMYGPRGVALLYVRQGVSIFPLVYGGGQEQSLRSGTENVPGIVGLAEAAKIIEKNRDLDSKKIGQLRDWLQAELEKLPGVLINAKKTNRLPNHLSVTLPGIKNRDLVKELDQQGIAVSAGSACSSKSLGDSHVLTAIGLTNEQISATIRVSFGRQTKKQDIQRVASAIIKKLAS
ncbi:MAG TPA: cysteine desulfurase family protein [Candidatus Saccharimonadales bacterium]|nr:cysteine desulfurase family protein [Candidatus Saccharimonadales bacterium]